MMADKLTPWFPPDVRPVHVGWYRTYSALSGPKNTHMAHWDGVTWMLTDGVIAGIQSRYWRGQRRP